MLAALFAALLLLVAPVPGAAQGKVYTKKAKLSDFPVSTTKVVLSSQSLLELTLHDEVISRWRVSPYEFCTVEDYQREKEDASFYFLRFVSEDGVFFLSLSRGGNQKAPSMLDRPFDVVRVPAGSVDAMSGQEISFLGAYVDIVQDFVEQAMVSDRVGYGGIAALQRSISGKTVFLSPSEAQNALSEGTPDGLAAVVVAPSSFSGAQTIYKMLITTDTHELCLYREEKCRNAQDAVFSERDEAYICSHNATVVR